ncbi:hypothetical protein [Spirosoma sp.]|uniref:hypothetical protein n=1 Tax=Spirosoma sp. TaxID=1899569 RepID=UPI003B3A58BF
MNPPLPLKEANLLHQLVTDYERYKCQGFADASVGVLRIIQQTCDQLIKSPDLFKTEELVIATKSGEQTITINASPPDRLGLKKAMADVSEAGKRALDKLAEDVKEEAREQPVDSEQPAWMNRKKKTNYP